MTSRRRFAQSILGASAVTLAGPARAAVNLLPLTTTFHGERKFNEVVAKAMKSGWRKYPIGHRMAVIAMELREVPYVGYTLEIDDKIECPSVNFNGLDCWTFFEAVLGLARMLERPKAAYSQEDLLREIEWTRYRGGKCSGGYLERIHYLNEWFMDNAARGNLNDLTRSLGGAEPLRGRESTEMTHLWKSYRYLRKNPSLRQGMAEVERKVTALPVWYIPNSKVKAAESKLENGDIIGIVTRGQGGVCSHVGLCMKTKDGLTRLMHASSNHKKVILDDSISSYLYAYKSHIGIQVARPLPTVSSIYDVAQYQANLARMSKG